MCYHTSTPSTAQLVKAFKNLQVHYQHEEIFHVTGFTRPYLPVTLNADPGAIVPARWKLIPFWVKTEDDAAKYANTLNAESESIFEKASYKNYILKNRGLLYVNGFYEPHKVAGQKETENYYIYYPSKEIFTIGVVYSDFKDYETNNVYPTFSVITTKANPLLEEIHNEKKRMPLIIPPSSREEWLSANTKEDIQQLMIPFEGELGAHKVFRVTGAKGDTNRPDIQNAI
ncbi:SOS response-associated peptidase [Sphingobacterium sp. InxBP1]|uniref:SOS response-associated peptidase n=1 Tax=Sphingobacterium sp. InxBP1 TaxID=2870328 RepID=UPI00224444A1|nr:SOS response-associated peptidase family protein [Sphingobacterium sp. InxBP1]MCW8309642.1 SOS response-associated peptidase [Sphingobacterium sp. InxBP1]